MTFIVYYSATLYQKDGERMPIKVGDIWYNRKARARDQQAVKITRIGNPDGTITVDACWSGRERTVPVKSFNGKIYAPTPREEHL